MYAPEIIRLSAVRQKQRYAGTAAPQAGVSVTELYHLQRTMAPVQIDGADGRRRGASQPFWVLTGPRTVTAALTYVRLSLMSAAVIFCIR
jgi:hypothetical protein